MKHLVASKNFMVVLGTKPKVLSILHKCSIPEPHPQSRIQDNFKNQSQQQKGYCPHEKELAPPQTTAFTIAGMKQ